MRKTFARSIAFACLLLTVVILICASCQKSETKLSEFEEDTKKPETQSIVGGQAVSINNRPFQGSS